MSVFQPVIVIFLIATAKFLKSYQFDIREQITLFEKTTQSRLFIYLELRKINFRKN